MKKDKLIIDVREDKAVKLMRIEMLDGSIFKMPNRVWQRAFDINYSGKEKEAIESLKQFREEKWIIVQRLER